MLGRILVASLVLAGCGDVVKHNDGGGDDGGGSGSDGGVDDGPPIDGPPSFLSCAGLASTCGTPATDNCCSSAMTIPNGTFLRGYDAVPGGQYRNDTYPATISSFILDKYEVTVGRFRKFYEAGYGHQAKPPVTGSGANPHLTGSGWDDNWNVSLTADAAALSAGINCGATQQNWTNAAGANETKPMNCITWYEAEAFCIWDGGRLPTEAEWLYAAGGATQQRAYPWSNPAQSVTIDLTYANYDSGAGDAGFKNVGSLSPRGDGRWGQTDLGGNASEWTFDKYDSTTPTAYPNPCTDCANMAFGQYKSVKGGMHAYTESQLRVAWRDYYPTGSRYPSVGFRCARAP